MLGLFLVLLQNNGSHSIVILNKDFLFFGLFIFGIIGNAGNLSIVLNKIIYPWLITFIFQNISYSKKHFSRLFLVFGVAVTYQVFKMTMFDISGHLNLDLMRLLKFSHTEFYLNKGEIITTTYYGTYVALLFFILFISFRFSYRFTYLRLSLFIIVVVLNIIAVKRAYWLAIIIASLYIMFNNSKNNRVYLKYLMIIFIIIVTAIIVAPYLKLLNMDELVYRLDSFINADKADESMANRYFRWGLAIGLFIHHPFGVGYTFFFETYHVGTTHNEYLANGLGYGIAGLIFYLLILVSYFKLIIKGLSINNQGYYIKLLGLSILIFIFIIGFTENFSYSNLSFNLYVWVILGLQGNPYLNIENGNQKRRIRYIS